MSQDQAESQPEDIIPENEQVTSSYTPEEGEPIPIEPAIQETETPEPYVVKIRVSPEQQANIKLIESTLKPSLPSQASYRATRHGLQPLFQVAVFVILLSVTLWAAIWGGPPLPYPTIQPETRSFYQNLQIIQPNTPVLVAIDYGPSFTTELDPAALAILSDLFARQVFVTFITTNPTGVPLIERLVSQVENNLSVSLISPADYVNLGYLPGEIAGLNSLANSIRSTYPMDIDGRQIWRHPVLDGLLSVSDFNSLIVLLDNAEHGKAWIEQVGMQLPQTPFYMITSAQAEPILQSYFQGDPKLMESLLSGLTDIVALENRAGRSDNARNMWNAYSLAVIAAVVLIFTGGLVSIITSPSRY